MYVRTKMSADPYTVEADAPITDVIALMKEKGLKRAPVVKDGRVAGIVTSGDIQQVSPNKATSLSIFEINYLLGKMTVQDAMTKNVFCIAPDAFLEEAAVLMRTNKISALPVVEQGRIVGIITESDIFDAFVELLGFKDPGSRISIEAADRPGVLAEVAAIIASFGISISHIAAYERGDGIDDVVVRVNTLEADEIIKEIAKRGYKIIDVTQNP